MLNLYIFVIIFGIFGCFTAVGFGLELARCWPHCTCFNGDDFAKGCWVCRMTFRERVKYAFKEMMRYW